MVTISAVDPLSACGDSNLLLEMDEERKEETKVIDQSVSQPSNLKDEARALTHTSLLHFPQSHQVS